MTGRAAAGRAADRAWPILAALPPLATAVALAAGRAPRAVGLALCACAAPVAAAAWAGPLAPLLLVFPFGPKFALGAGNLYAGTAIAALAVGGWLLLAAAGARRPGSALPGRLGASLLAWLALLGLSGAAHLADLLDSPAQLLRAAQFALYLLLLPLAADLAGPGRRAGRLLWVALLAAGAQALYGMLLAPPGPRGFAVGTFDWEHNHFAAEMTLGILLAAGAAIARGGAARAAALACAAACAAGLLLSQSRAGLLGTAAGVASLALLPLRRPWRALIAAGLAAAAAAILWLAPPELRERLAAAAGAGGGDVALARRFGMWREAWEVFRQAPLAGGGLGSRPLADNFYVKSLAEMGLPGLLGFGWLLFETLRAARSAAADECRRLAPASGRGEGGASGLAIGLWGATVGLLLVMNAAGDYFMLHRVMGSYWLLLGALFAREAARAAARPGAAPAGPP